MHTPLHPLIVHFPIALTFILPLMILVCALMIKKNKMTPKGWFIVVGLQMAIVGGGYISLETGETEEHEVEKGVSKKLIHEHEEAAEVFVGSAVVALVLSLGAYFVKRELGFKLKLVVFVISLISCYLVFKAAELGGELVYKHGAFNAYIEASDEPTGLLPTPGLNTSESPMPVDENESLKPDDNDYGNADEVVEPSDDESKRED
jgi:uncharacterized membrane protein